MPKQSLNIVVMAGKQAGMLGILTTLALQHKILAIIPYDDITMLLCRKLGIKFYKSIKDKELRSLLQISDLLLSVHGREIVPKEIIAMPRLGAINVHPCLYRYKGKDPIKRMLEDNVTNASVGVHYMTEKVDKGEVITEIFVDVAGEKTIEGVYNRLYPYYVEAIINAFQKLE